MPQVSFQLTTLDVTLILGLTLGIVLLGLLSARRVKNTTDGYFLASGQMPWWLIGTAFVSTSVSSEQIVGTLGQVYQSGLSIANWEWWCLPTYGLLMVFFIPMYLRNKIMTLPAMLEKRFGPACGGIYSFVILIGYLLIFLPPVLYGGSLTISELTGWPQWAVLIGITILTGSYTLLGGLESVMWTDAIQCVLLIGGGLVLFFVSLNHIPGGWDEMVKASPDRFHLYKPPSDPDAPFAGLILGSFGVFLFYQAANQVMIQRVLSARSTWDGMMGIIFAGFINIIRPLVTCLLGLVVYHWIEVKNQAPSLLPDNYDKVFPFALAEFAPSGVRGIILAGFFAAIMSTVSSLGNAISTIFSLDVYKRFIRKEAADRELIRVGRISGGVALLIATAIAPLISGIGLFKYFQTGVTYMATPFISVLLMGIFWKRTSYAGAIAGLIGGVVIQLGIAGLILATGWAIHWLYVGSIAQVLTMSLIAIVSLNSTPPTPAQYTPFLWKPSWLSAYDEGSAKRPWYQLIKFWFALYAVAWCAVYWIFW